MKDHNLFQGNFIFINFYSSSDGLIKVWSLQSYKCLSTLDDHYDKVNIYVNLFQLVVVF